MDAILVLEDGTAFRGRAIGKPGTTTGEVVFNTSMTGYQEILTDPSYRGQIVVMTCPHIGNTGVNAEDVESNRVQAEALVAREFSPISAGPRTEDDLARYLRLSGRLGVSGFDTRALVRRLRMRGVMRGAVSSEILDEKQLLALVLDSPSMAGRALALEAGPDKPWDYAPGPEAPPAIPGVRRPRIAALDFGMKTNLLRHFALEGCDVRVFPGRATADEIRGWEPDGVFLSNGPGDPEPLAGPIAEIRSLLEYRPILGVCLGHQLLGLALGGKTYKLPFGHRGGNHPVRDVATGRVEITSQNHGFAVDPDSLPAGETTPTHWNLYDKTLEGFRATKLPVTAIQFHPEAAPGPHDSTHLIADFVATVRGRMRPA